MRKIVTWVVIVTISAVIGILVAVVSNIMALRPEPSIQTEENRQSTEQLLKKIEKRLESIQEDLQN